MGSHGLVADRPREVHSSVTVAAMDPHPVAFGCRPCLGAACGDHLDCLLGTGAAGHQVRLEPDRHDAASFHAWRLRHFDVRSALGPARCACFSTGQSCTEVCTGTNVVTVSGRLRSN